MILGLLLASISYAADYSIYDKLKATFGKKHPTSSIVVEGKTLEYNAYIRDEKAVPKYYLDEAVKVASEVSISYIRNNYKENCDKGGKIDIFQVSFSELNIPYKVVPYSYAQFGTLWGYYDPRTPYDNLDAISFAYHQDNTTHIIIAHEIAHYWYERLCAYSGNTTDSEGFAKIIEEIYTKKYNF